MKVNDRPCLCFMLCCHEGVCVCLVSMTVSFPQRLRGCVVLLLWKVRSLQLWSLWRWSPAVCCGDGGGHTSHDLQQSDVIFIWWTTDNGLWFTVRVMMMSVSVEMMEDHSEIHFCLKCDERILCRPRPIFIMSLIKWTSSLDEIPLLWLSDCFPWEAEVGFLLSKELYGKTFICIFKPWEKMAIVSLRKCFKCLCRVIIRFFGKGSADSSG